jgi:hypothetical protein
MTDPWTTLVALAIATAVLPIQLTIAWIGGMTLVCLAQFADFGVVLDQAMDDAVAGTSPADGALLLVVAVLLLVSAVGKLAKAPDEDAPPPRWMTKVAEVTPSRVVLKGGRARGAESEAVGVHARGGRCHRRCRARARRGLAGVHRLGDRRPGATPARPAR